MATTYGYDFSWTPKDGGLCRVHGKGFDTIEDARGAFRRALDAFGYEPPKWWQWWRWGEHIPGPYQRGAGAID